MSTWQEYVKTMRPEAKIHIFSRSGDLEGLKKVMTPENIDEPDSRGHTPLILACYHGHKEAAAYLLDHGASRNVRDHSGNTALMGASFKGHLEIVRLLVERGADAELENPHGLTSLGFANLFGRTDVAAYLSSLPN